MNILPLALHADVALMREVGMYISDDALRFDVGVLERMGYRAGQHFAIDHAATIVDGLMPKRLF